MPFLTNKKLMCYFRSLWSQLLCLLKSQWKLSCWKSRDKAFCKFTGNVQIIWISIRKSHLQNCSSFTDADRKDSPKYCFKTATFVAGKAEMVIHRGCLVGDAKNFCDLERDKDSKLSCSLCSTTLCNSGAFVTVSKIILAIAIFNSLWIYMF